MKLLIFYHFQRNKQLEAYPLINGMYLMPGDGSQYFSSEKISCPSCLTKTSKGSTRCHHQILQAVIVHPDNKQVIPLVPEAIQNTDGTEKQDCEINAAKRLIKKIRKTHPKLKIIFGCRFGCLKHEYQRFSHWQGRRIELKTHYQAILSSVTLSPRSAAFVDFNLT